MGKTSRKVTKDPRRVERGKKSYEKHMKRLKEEILEELSTNTDRNRPSTSSSTGNSTPTPSHTTRSNNTYVYGAGILAMLASVFVYFLHITLFSLLKNSSMIAWRLSISKSRLNHQKDVTYFRKIYNKISSFDWKKTLQTPLRMELS